MKMKRQFAHARRPLCGLLAAALMLAVLPAAGCAADEVPASSPTGLASQTGRTGATQSLSASTSASSASDIMTTAQRRTTAASARRTAATTTSVRTQPVTTTASREITTTTAKKEPEAEEQKILFIGNSLTDEGSTPAKFEKLAKAKGKKVEVASSIKWGQTLYVHAGDFISGMAEEYLDYDTVILQEAGYNEDMQTREAVEEIISCYGPDTRFYIFVTHYDTASRGIMYQLKDVPNLTYIPIGFVHDKMLEKGYAQYTDLHVSLEDFHPNEAFGYLAALTVYRVLYNESCADLPPEAAGLAQKDIPGATPQEKETFIRRMKECVEEVVKGFS